MDQQELGGRWYGTWPNVRCGRGVGGPNWSIEADELDNRPSFYNDVNRIQEIFLQINLVLPDIGRIIEAANLPCVEVVSVPSRVSGAASAFCGILEAPV